MKKKIINVIMGVAVVSVAIFNVDIVASNGHSISNLNSIVKSALADGEGGGGWCSSRSSDYYNAYGGCYFHDHIEWCEGDLQTLCTFATWQEKMCYPSMEWENVCYQPGASFCSN